MRLNYRKPPSWLLHCTQLTITSAFTLESIVILKFQLERASTNLQKSMGTFKIVATKEKKGIYFSVVPHHWEADNVLLWPDQLSHARRELLRRDGNSIPQSDWNAYPCIVKFSKIGNFKDALVMEKQLTSCSDTEAEEVLIEHLSKNKRSATKKLTCSLTDRNDMFSDETDVDIHSPRITTPDAETHASTPTTSFVTMYDNTIIEAVDESQILVSSETLLKVHEDIESIQKDLCDIKKNMMEQYTKINVNLDRMYKLMASQMATVNPVEKDSTKITKENLLEKFSFPLESYEEVSKLDQEILQSQEFKLALMEFLTQFGGSSGDKDGTKVAYKIVDHLFSPNLLTNYSWTGVSRGKIEKKSFQSLVNILSVFHDVLLLADSRHTRQKNECIFKEGVLKHAKKRCLRRGPKTKSLQPTSNDNCTIEDDTNEGGIEIVYVDDCNKENTLNNIQDTNLINL